MASQQQIRLGVIGIDTSHFPAFSKGISGMNEAGETRCRVTRYWTDGKHDRAQDIVDKYCENVEALGAKRVSTMEQLLDEVDGVLVQSLSGHKHLKEAMPALERGMPVYLDKPLSFTVEDAKAIRDAARRHNAPCYSASAMRTMQELDRIDRERIGTLVAIDAFGTGSDHPSSPPIFYYGVHTIEMVDQIWGPGVRRVSAIRTVDRDLCDLEYHDGRYARLRMERKGKADIGATLHGDQGTYQFTRDRSQTPYVQHLRALVRFFETGEPPVPLRDILENVAVMVAANRSIEQEGAWVEIAPVE